MSRKRLALVAFLASLVVASVTGCTAGGSSVQNTASTASSPVASSTGPSRPPIALQTIVPEPDAPQNTSELGVVSLEVQGDVMILRYQATPDFASKSDSEKIGLADVMGAGIFYPASQMTLIDRENLKEYSVLYGDGKFFGTSGVDTVNGTPAFGYAVFAAPEDDIDRIDVSFNQQFASLEDVRITVAEK